MYSCRIVLSGVQQVPATAHTTVTAQQWERGQLCDTAGMAGEGGPFLPSSLTAGWPHLALLGLGLVLPVLLLFRCRRRAVDGPGLAGAVAAVEGGVAGVTEFVLPRQAKRFRKRDRVRFYGRRMLRRVEDTVRYVEGVGRGAGEGGHRLVRSLLLGGGDGSDSGPGEGSPARPAEDWLEEEEASGRRVPPELKYLLDSFHMFGQFDPALFAEMYPAIESLRLTAGQFLFKIGDPDRFIFVVQSGQLAVTTTDSQASCRIKTAGPGESLTSLLSFIDVLTGHEAQYKTVEAQAQVDSVVLRLGVRAFLPVFASQPELQVRVVQVIMARVQRVIFTGLHRYLGLSQELIRPFQPEPGDDGGGQSLEAELAAAEGGVGAANRAEGARWLGRELGLGAGPQLGKLLELREYSRGDLVLREAQHSDLALGCVVKGEVTMYQEDQGGTRDRLYSAQPGECFGQLAVITGEATFYSCQATAGPTVLALLSRTAFQSLASQSPGLELALARSTTQRLSPLVRKVDFALDWRCVEAGRTVRAGQESTLLVLSGRLRGYTAEPGGEKRLRGEYGRGDMVGLVDVITGAARRKVYLSVRDSEVCVIPGQLLLFLRTRSMVVMSKLVSILSNRLVSGEAGPGQPDNTDNTATLRYTR